MTITRAQLRKAIEAGIASATKSGLLDTDADALRRVADTATAVQAGGAYPSGTLPVGCPAYQADLWPSLSAGEPAPGITGGGGFAHRFDCAIERILDVDLNAEAVVVAVTD
jgi:hypothetical protein